MGYKFVDDSGKEAFKIGDWVKTKDSAKVYKIYSIELDVYGGVSYYDYLKEKIDPSRIEQYCKKENIEKVYKD